DDHESRTNTSKLKLDEPIFHEKPAMIEERERIISMRVLTNDDTTENLVLLTGLKNLIKIQLPNMPPEYITRLVYDKRHYSLAIVKSDRVVGGITYRLFPENKLAEIVFCVVSSTEQAKGYGSHLMNHLKDLLKGKEGIKYLMTYADNHAMGFFKKNGFTTDITLEKNLWVGFIKDYDEATIMQ
ncbi:1929_t:CDS:2, partial [Acaulospora colombiana]